MKDLPRFKPRPYKEVLALITRALTNERQAQVSSLERLTAFPNGHYRAVFRSDYFALPEGQTEPTNSQWNTLKKRLKRLDKNVFIFKEHGVGPCAERGDGRCYYVDFGFLESLREGRAR